MEDSSLAVQLQYYYWDYYHLLGVVVVGVSLLELL
jgi:hypothetical protein